MFWRNFITLLRRYTASSLLNIVGMAIAFAAVYLIAVQVKFDLSYNHVIKNSERIYRLEHPHWFDEGLWDCSWNRQWPDEVSALCPEIEAAGSFHITPYSSQREYSVKRNSAIENYTIEIATAEPEGLAVFPFEFVAGSLADYNTTDDMIISESTAKRCNLKVGDRLHYGRGAESSQMRTIVAIFKDFPQPSSIARTEGWFCMPAQDDTSKDNWGDPYYIRLREGTLPEEVEKRMNDYIIEDARKRGLSEEDIKTNVERTTVRLTPIGELYFTADSPPEALQGSRITTYTIIAIAVLILVISFINFVNFFFALIPSRIRAVNNYKIFGAPTAKLRLSFLFETVGLILVSLFGAAVIVVLFTDTPLKEYISTSVDIDENWSLAGAIAFCMILFGVVVSLYPAWYITKFSPAFVIKGDFSASRAGRILRYTLVGVQYTISISLIICSLFIYRQHQYMLTRDMGFNKENLLAVDVPDDAIFPDSFSYVMDYTKRDALVDKLKQNPQITEVIFGGQQLVSWGGSGGNYAWGRPIDGEHKSFGVYTVSWDFLKVMDIEIVEGRDFLPSDEQSETGAMIFNQKATQTLGVSLESIMMGHIQDENANIVGICENFNTVSAYHDVQPYAFLVWGRYGGDMPSHAYIRTVAGADIAAVRKYIFDTIMEFAPNADPEKVEVKFFDNELELVYQREDKLSTLVTLFSFLSIVISIIGVFGLVLFETQYRRREIAIRRVYGASFSGILTLFNLKYVCIVAICSAIAIPISYYVIDNWMQKYVYRTPMSWWVYAVPVAIILAITLITVTLRSWRAATENPADVVKSN